MEDLEATFRFTVDDPHFRKGLSMKWNDEMDEAHYSLKTSIEALRAYENDILNAWRAKKEGVPVVWTSVWGPFQVIIRAFDFAYIGIETCAEWFGRYRITGRFVNAAEREGISRDVCNFLTGPYGFLLEGKKVPRSFLPWGWGYPEPDFTIECNSLCDDQMKVFQNITHRKIKEGTHWNTFIIDVPFNVTGGDENEVEHEIVEYEVAQLEHLIRWVEQKTGKKLDENRLAQSVMNANEMSRLGKEITELRKAIPAPMSFLDSQECVLGPMLNLLGTDIGVEIMRMTLEEIRVRVKDGMGVVPDEKVRLMWSNTPPWPNMGLFSYWHPEGVVFAFETNTSALRFHIGYQLDPDKPLETLCRKFLPHTTNSDKRRCIEDRMNTVKEYKIDGVVHSSNYGCRPYNLGIVDEIISIQKASGYAPQLIVDQDMTNEQFYDDRRIKNHIQTLIEVIKEEKSSKV